MNCENEMKMNEPAWQVRDRKGRAFRDQIPFLFPFERESS